MGFEIQEGIVPNSSSVYQQKSLNVQTQSEDLIDLNEIEAGVPFKGIAFCLETISNRNKLNPNKSNLTFKLLDKNGIPFLATIFEASNLDEINNIPILIKEGIKPSRFDDRIFYNLQKIEYLPKDSVPVSMFLKKIDKLAYKEEKLKSILSNSPTSDSNINNHILFLLQNGYISNIASNILSDKYGTRIGAGIDIILMAYDLLNGEAKRILLNTETKTPIYGELFLDIIYKVIYDTMTNSVISSLKNKTKEINTNNFLKLMSFRFGEDLNKVITKFNLYSGNYNIYKYMKKEQDYQNLYDSLFNTLKTILIY